MKLFGIACLFLACLLTGFVAAERGERRHRILQSVGRNLDVLLLHVAAQKLPLSRILELLQGEPLAAYLQNPETDLPEELTAAEQKQLFTFLQLLKGGTSEQIRTAGAALRNTLQQAEREEEQRAGNTRLFRTVGALAGAVLAVLLW